MSTLLAELHKRLPADRIQTDTDVLSAYAQDRALFEQAGRAAVLVVPRSTADVVAAVEAANAADVPIVPRGAGSGLTGAANAIDDCLMLSMHRMNRVLEIDVINRMARVEPGIINADLKRAVADVGLYYPPDPASVDMCSIGGNVATNAGGLCCVKYGVTRDYVVGLEVVLPTGQVIRTGRSRTLKKTAGLDLTGLFVGSEGLLGIVTEVTVRLVPAPAPASTAVAFFNELEPAGTAVAEIFERRHEPSLMEIIDRASIRQVERVYDMGLDVDAACLLIMQTEGDEAGAGISAMADLCQSHGATLVHHATDPDEGRLLVEARRRVWPALEKLDKQLLPEDVAVPRQRLAELLRGIDRVAASHEVFTPTIGHAGDGNMHPIFVLDPSDADEVARAKDAFEAILDLSLELGGTIAAEHGVGTLKKAFLAREIDPVDLALQRRIKETFDPHHRLNPGKSL